MYIYVLYISIYLQRYISPHIYRDIFIDIWGFPGASVVRNPPSNAGDTSKCNPRVRKNPGEGNGKPLQYTCPGNHMDKGAWWATVHGVTRIGHD